MPIPPNVSRVVLGGAVDGGEEWSTGFWLSGGGDAATILGDIDNEAVEPFFTAIAPDMFAAFHFDYIKVYTYANGGTQATSMAEKAETGVGGLTGAGSPFSTCLVVSLLTATPGKSNRGRMYLPMHLGTGPNGHTDSTLPASMGGAVRTMLDTIRGNATGATPVIVSRTHSRATPITSVRADDLPDSQRRRDESLTASRIYSQALASS